MFAYCENNPVNGSDPTGEWVHIVVGAVVGAATAGLGMLICGQPDDMTDKQWTEAVVKSMLWSAASGALSAALPGAGGAVSVVLSAAESITTDLSNKESTGTIVADAIISASFGAVSGFADDFISTREATTGIRNVIQSVSKTTRGNHPKVKISAKRTKKKFTKKAGRSLLSSLLWGTSTAYGSNIATRAVKPR